MHGGEGRLQTGRAAHEWKERVATRALIPASSRLAARWRLGRSSGREQSSTSMDPYQERGDKMSPATW